MHRFHHLRNVFFMNQNNKKTGNTLMNCQLESSLDFFPRLRHLPRFLVMGEYVGNLTHLLYEKGLYFLTYGYYIFNNSTGFQHISRKRRNNRKYEGFQSSVDSTAIFMFTTWRLITARSTFTTF